MIATRTATLSRIGLVVVLLGSFTTAALAQGSVQLNVALSEGTRSVEVTNLAGAPLEDLTLVPGQASSYRVTVTDADYLTDEPFTVEAQNGNLYLVEAAGGPVGAGEVVAGGQGGGGVGAQDFAEVLHGVGQGQGRLGGSELRRIPQGGCKNIPDAGIGE